MPPLVLDSLKIEGYRLFDAEWSDARAPQRLDQAAAAKALADVTGQRADVGPLAATHLQLEMRIVVAQPSDGDHGQLRRKRQREQVEKRGFKLIQQAKLAEPNNPTWPQILSQIESSRRQAVVPAPKLVK